MTVEAIILAGGAGARMRSKLPKSLHAVGGRPMLAHIFDAVSALEPAAIRIVVSAERGHEVRAAIESGAAELAQPAALDKTTWTPQDKPRGTGHAAALAMANVARAATVLVVYGDTPLIDAATLRRLLAAADGGRFGLLTITAADADAAAGLGRIVRDDAGRVARIVEGRLQKYLQEIALLKQPFVKDEDQSVGQLLKRHSATVRGFHRYEVGEGIEKKKENFAEEVMAQARSG